MKQEIINALTWYANKMEDVVKYNWSSGYKEEYITKAHKKFTEELSKHIDFYNLTMEDCKELHFGNWDGSGLMLIPFYLYDVIPVGMELTSISGMKDIFPNIDNDTRFGCLAYGIYPKA